VFVSISHMLMQFSLNLHRKGGGEAVTYAEIMLNI